ncbi:receptor-like protein kinase FERONIA [Rhododendron vialii]|uniref:receptor-like protein kinase FERONIA n=1 Tax=Rhododendron vialii TaxID=182163 RepID=UPI00265F1407|nr:receptor-like protein kinase FERONIA [Rhododendron vialii]
MSIPPYSAPQKVYQTSWSLVPDKQANKTESNLTWRLPVDLGFRYLLRLHFCGLEYEIKEIGRVEFSIFVNEQVVEAKVDLIQWSGGNGVAVFKDYVVIMDGDRMEGKRDLLIALRPQNHEWMEPIDATLKGLEVFKLSNTDKNLAGVNPVPLARTSTSPKPKKLVFASVGNAIVTCVEIVLIVFSVIVFQWRCLSENSARRTLSLSTSEGLCRRFSLAELMSVTNNFNDEFVIGSGGFGKVYKALIDDHATTVALKRCNLKSQGAKEFWTEIEMLSKLRHTHLVSLLGYCDERNEMILVYEFMEHGTLADHLYKTKTKGNGTVGYMSWVQRLNICVGAARGLDYLHTGIRHGIIHRDVKTTNILLDKDWIAKISDFGLCKVGSTSHSQTYVSTDVKGTRGYLDPEYYMTHRLTKKSDVYAFGVVMLEMLCGRPAVDMQVDEEQHSLVLWAKQCIKENKLDQLIDPSLRDQISAHCLKVFAEVANNCLDSRPKGRPTMADVVVRLEYALASERAVDEQFGENTQGRNRSKGNVSKVLQRTFEFLAKGADIKWKKRKTISQSKGILKRRDTEDWMRHCQLPEYLKRRVRRFVQNKRLATQRVDEETILSRLPSDLRRDIQRHVRLDLVRRVPFFSEMDDQLLDAIWKRLVSSLSTEGTYIVREGDPVTKMVFIIRGSLESSTTNRDRFGFFDSVILRAGDFCGEELLAWALLPKSTTNLPSSTRTVRALVEVEAFALRAEDLSHLTSFFHQFGCLHSKKLQHTLRYYSPNWRTWAARVVQAAWRRYKWRSWTKGLTAIESSAESGTRQEEKQDGSSVNSSPSQANLAVTVLASKFAANIMRHAQNTVEKSGHAHIAETRRTRLLC